MSLNENNEPGVWGPPILIGFVGPILLVVKKSISSSVQVYWGDFGTRKIHKMNKEKNHEVLVPWGRTALVHLPHLFIPQLTNRWGTPQKWKTALWSGLVLGPLATFFEWHRGFKLHIKPTPTKRTVLHLHEGKPVVFTSPYIIRLAFFLWNQIR